MTHSPPWLKTLRSVSYAPHSSENISMRPKLVQLYTIFDETSTLTFQRTWRRSVPVSDQCRHSRLHARTWHRRLSAMFGTKGRRPVTRRGGVRREITSGEHEMREEAAERELKVVSANLFPPQRWSPQWSSGGVSSRVGDLTGLGCVELKTQPSVSLVAGPDFLFAGL